MLAVEVLHTGGDWGSRKIQSKKVTPSVFFNTAILYSFCFTVLLCHSSHILLFPWKKQIQVITILGFVYVFNYWSFQIVISNQITDSSYQLLNFLSPPALFFLLNPYCTNQHITIYSPCLVYKANGRIQPMLQVQSDCRHYFFKKNNKSFYFTFILVGIQRLNPGLTYLGHALNPWTIYLTWGYIFQGVYRSLETRFSHTLTVRQWLGAMCC